MGSTVAQWLLKYWGPWFTSWSSSPTLHRQLVGQLIVPCMIFYRECPCHVIRWWQGLFMFCIHHLKLWGGVLLSGLLSLEDLQCQDMTGGHRQRKWGQTFPKGAQPEIWQKFLWLHRNQQSQHTLTGVCSPTWPCSLPLQHSSVPILHHLCISSHRPHLHSSALAGWVYNLKT